MEDREMRTEFLWQTIWKTVILKTRDDWRLRVQRRQRSRFWRWRWI